MKLKVVKSSRLAPRIEPSLKTEIEEACRVQGIRPSEFARQALVAHLQRVRT